MLNKETANLRGQAEREADLIVKRSQAGNKFA